MAGCSLSNATWGRLCDTIWHETAHKYLVSEAQTRGIIKGNQGGGTRVAMSDAAMRLLGIHPVERRNVLQKPIRCISKCLPKSDEDEENQQYVEFKTIFPPEYIKRDLTARAPHMIIRDPKGGSDNKIEFLSKKQEVDAFMSVQRAAYYQDEEIDKTKWDENVVRLLRYGGDITICLTPVMGLDWTYDVIWSSASVIYRSETISQKFNLPQVEETGNDADIEVFQWATDDNPVMDVESIERLLQNAGIDDEDEDDLAMRRYGVFRQVSGRIYKSFDPTVHVIPWDEYWNPRVFQHFWHYRIIDYHPTKPWFVSWVAVTPQHEWFVWNELRAFHDNVTTPDLRDKIKRESLLDEEDPYNRGVEIDPLANVKQANTGFSVFEDLSRGPHGLRGCRPAITTSKDQQGNEHGRMNIRRRLNNSLNIGRPFANESKMNQPEARFEYHLPTIWFFDTCKGHVEHFKKWRTVDFKQEHVKATRDAKRPAQKWSDYCRNLEFLGARDPVWYDMPHTERSRSPFQGRKAA